MHLICIFIGSNFIEVDGSSTRYPTYEWQVRLNIIISKGAQIFPKI